MHSSRPLGGTARYSAKSQIKPVNFYCLAPEARQVFIVGDFNDWNPAAHPIEKQHDGNWTVQVQLNHGYHHYMFSIDGRLTLDPRAQGVARNEMNEKVSMMSVS